jgi:hypothetical protein
MKLLKVAIYSFFLLFTFTEAYSQLHMVESKEHNFRIQFYEEPEYSCDSSASADDMRITHTWEVEVKDTTHPNFSYYLEVEEFSPEIMHSDSTGALVDDFLDTFPYLFSGNPGFEVLSSSLIIKNGYPGKECFWLVKEQNNVIVGRLFLIKNKAYIFLVVPNPGKSNNRSIYKFFNSFELIDIPKGNYTIPVHENEKTYSIDFPSEPKEQVDIAESEMGSLIIRSSILETKKNSGIITYSVSTTTYPSAIVDYSDSLALEDLYKTSIDASIQGMGTTKILVERKNYKKINGKKVISKLKKHNAFIISYVFFYKKRYYMISLLQTSTATLDEEGKKFFDSFEILDYK